MKKNILRKRMLEFLFNNMLWLNVLIAIKFKYYAYMTSKSIKKEKNEFYKKNYFSFYKNEDLTDEGKYHHKKTKNTLKYFALLNLLWLLISYIKTHNP